MWINYRPRGRKCLSKIEVFATGSGGKSVDNNAEKTLPGVDNCGWLVNNFRSPSLSVAIQRVWIIHKVFSGFSTGLSTIIHNPAAPLHYPRK